MAKTPAKVKIRSLHKTPMNVDIAGGQVDPDCLFEVEGTIDSEGQDHWVLRLPDGQLRALQKEQFAVESPYGQKQE